MTSLPEALQALRAQVTEQFSGRGATDLHLDRAHFFDPDELRRSDDVIEVLSVQPVAALTVEQLADFLGATRRLPRPPDGGPRTVLFTETLPGEDEVGATVLAEIDAENRVSRLVIRADHY